jgi:hypothetical protein
VDDMTDPPFVMATDRRGFRDANARRAALGFAGGILVRPVERQVTESDQRAKAKRVAKRRAKKGYR